MSSAPNPERFRDLVLERADQRGLTTDQEIHDAGGPSSSTMTNIRKARPTKPRGDTFKRLDKALDWPEGSARKAWLLGVTPGPEDDAYVSAPGERVEGGTVTNEEIFAAITEMRRDIEELKRKRHP